MMRILAGTALLILTSAIAIGGTGQDCGEVKTDRLITRCLIIPDDDFTLDRLTTRAREFLAEISSRYSFGRLLLVTRERDLDFVWAKPSTDLDDEWWLSEYDKLRKTLFPIAGVTVVSGGCALQMRDGSGKITKSVLTKRDPLIITARTGQYELLHAVANSFDEQYLRNFGGDPIGVYLFLEAKSGSGVTLEPDLWLGLSTLLGTKALSLHVLPNHWFTTDDPFPVVYPFRPAVPPPTLSEIHSHPISWCMGYGGGLHCGLATVEKTEYAEYDFQGRRR